MKDRAWIEAKREEIRQRKAQLLADFHVHCGAEQLCDQLLADDPPLVSPDQPTPHEEGSS